MKRKILISYQIPREGLIDLSNKFDVKYPDKTMFTRKELLTHIPDYDGLISVFGEKVYNEILDKGDKLKIISNFGAGYDNIDINFATKKKIVVTNTPDVVTEPAAEIAFGLMLSLMRKISECNNKLRSEKDFQWGIMKNLGRTLNGKTLGIIGMGKIGRAVTHKAVAFGMKIIYYDLNPLSPELEKNLSVVYFSLTDLLKNSDVISIHTPLTDQTFHLLGKKEFEMMKPTAYLINTARGPVIDENILVEFLKTKKIAGAGLDVFENEPTISKDLLAMGQVVLTPHIGTGTIETRIEMAKAASRNIIDFFEGKIPKYVVNKEVL